MPQHKRSKLNPSITLRVKAQNYKSFPFLFFLVIILAFILRIYKADTLPHHLYFDEVSIGWNAYSVLKTGYDEYGKFLPLAFEAFGDYKLPGYVYAVSLSEFILGKSELAVRMPSILAGTLSVGLLVLILKLLKLPNNFCLLASFLLSISPWHLQFSRGGFEANLALFFVLLGLFFFLKAIFYYMAFFLPLIFFILTLYTYNAQKILTPLFALSLIILFRQKLAKILNTKSILILFFTGLILALPIIRFSLSEKGLIKAKSESFIQDVKITPDNFFQNLPFLQLERLMKNYASYFSFDFLFLRGDLNGRHSVREMGENYLWQLPFFLYGIYIAFKRKGDADELFFFFLIFAPLAGSFFRPSPHALRSLVMVIPTVFFTSTGMYGFIKSAKCKVQSAKLQFKAQSFLNVVISNKFNYLIITLITTYFFLSYLHIYYVHYPKRTSPDWTGGYKETAEFLVKNEQKYEKILLTDKFQNGYVYLLFYGDHHFRKGRALRKGPSFPYFPYEVVTSPYTKDLEENMLYLAPPWEKRPERQVKTIYDFSNNEVFTIWER